MKKLLFIFILLFTVSAFAESDVKPPYSIKLTSLLNKENKTHYVKLKVINLTSQPIEDVQVILELYTDELHNSHQTTEYHCIAGLNSKPVNIDDYIENAENETASFFIQKIKGYGHFSFALELEKTDLFKLATLKAVDSLGRSLSKTYPRPVNPEVKHLYEEIDSSELELVMLSHHNNESCFISL